MLKVTVLIFLISIYARAEVKTLDKGWTDFKFIDAQGNMTTGEVKNYRRSGNIKHFKKFRADPRLEKHINISVPVTSKALPNPFMLNQNSKFHINKGYQKEVRNIKTTKTKEKGSVGLKVKDGLEIKIRTSVSVSTSRVKIFGSSNGNRSIAKQKDNLAGVQKTKNTLPKASKSGWDPYASLRKFYD